MMASSKRHLKSVSEEETLTKFSQHRSSNHSLKLCDYEDSLRKPLYGILMKAPFFDNKNYEKGRGVFKKWTMKMFKFCSDSGVLSYCDAGTFQTSNQTSDTPTVMLGKCQYFHVGMGAVCQSVPEEDDVDKCQFIFRIEGLTGVHAKSLYLASFTPEDRLKWVTRITNYTQDQKMDYQKLKEHQRMKALIATQDEQIRDLQEELEGLTQVSGYLKGQVKKYQTVALRMREDNAQLLDKLEVVSKEISGLRSSLKETNLSDQINLINVSDSENEGDFLSPEVQYLDRFSKYLDFKRQDIMRMSNRKKNGSPGESASSPLNISPEQPSNNLSNSTPD